MRHRARPRLASGQEPYHPADAGRAAEVPPVWSIVASPVAARVAAFSVPTCETGGASSHRVWMRHGSRGEPRCGLNLGGVVASS